MEMKACGDVSFGFRTLQHPVKSSIGRSAESINWLFSLVYHSSSDVDPAGQARQQPDPFTRTLFPGCVT